jgi:hypothetical protein
MESNADEQGESSTAEKETVSSVLTNVANKSHHDANVNVSRLKKVAPNKWSIPQTTAGGDGNDDERSSKRQNNNFEFASRHHNSKRPRWSAHHSSGPSHGVAKRIALTIKTTESEDTVEEEEEGAAEKPTSTSTGTNDATATSSEQKLTDFAYRQTSRVVQRGGHNRTWSSSSGGGIGAPPAAAAAKSGSRNMGLVRVQPNEKKTPICPVFLRGVECTDKYCRKRHDVPKEFATPVCSFFQRHGQCLKGDECMFRHVKVNPRATVCPSFALLGFCEDKDCAMKHVRENKRSS